MKQRFITGIIMALVLLPLIIFEQLFFVFQIVMLAFVVIGVHELLSMYAKEKPFNKIIQCMICVFAIVTYLVALDSFNFESLGGLEFFSIKLSYVSVFMLISAVLFGTMVFFESFDGRDVGKALTIINYVALGSAAVTALRFMGLRYIFYLFIITIFTDIFAYLFGMKFGKHKMCPKISPKKSWEGAIGGTVIATIAGTCFAFFYGTIFNDPNFPTLLSFTSLGEAPSFVQFIILFFITLTLSIAGQIGDLVASRLKRTYEIKDFGKIFPGHGGVLDRFDSAIYGALYLLGIFMILKDFFPLV